MKSGVQEKISIKQIIAREGFILTCFVVPAIIIGLVAEYLYPVDKKVSGKYFDVCLWILSSYFIFLMIRLVLGQVKKRKEK